MVSLFLHTFISTTGGAIGLKSVLWGIDWEVPTLLFTQQNNLAS